MKVEGKEGVEKFGAADDGCLYQPPRANESARPSSFSCRSSWEFIDGRESQNPKKHADGHIPPSRKAQSSRLTKYPHSAKTHLYGVGCTMKRSSHQRVSQRFREVGCLF